MGSAVKETLKSLCSSYGWSYGVLWQFDQQNPMLLTLGEAYGDEMRGLIDDMLLQVHILGRGVVGEAAFSGRDQWICSDGHCKDENSMGSAYQNDEPCSELHNQFKFGIKTIVAIPLESHGVVQFGSTKKIPEILEFSNQAKKILLEKINDQQVNATNYGSDEWLDALLSNGLSACRNQVTRLSDTSDELTGEICDSIYIPHSQASVSKLHSETMDIFCADPDVVLSDMMSLEQLFSTESTSGSPFVFPATPITSDGASQNFQDDSQFASAYNFEELFDAENATQVNLGACDVMKSDIPGNDVLQWPVAPPESRAHDLAAVTKDDASPFSGVSTSSSSKKGSVDTLYSCEAPSALKVTNTFSQNVPHLQSCPPTVNSFTSGISKLDAIYASRPRKGLFSELGLEQLLSSAPRQSSCSYDDHHSTSKRRKTVSSSPTDSQIQSEVYSCLSEKISSFQHHLRLSRPENLGSQQDFMPKPQTGLWIDDRYNGSNNLMLSTRPQERSKPISIKKRAKPGESTRPRPKDRQLFQDRLGDLRKMIPNTGKLSIDALLDRTIKHLTFLQNVTKYEEKLKRIADQKEKGVISKDSAKGVTWAWELSDQAMICPIKVEDVGSSGEMLIEMLCDNGVSFLEIADTIRGFGLCILTGSMEDRNDKTWARFIVEPQASKSLTRVDVFWSLAQRLQQTTASGTDSVSQLPHKAIGTASGGQSHYPHYQNLPPPILADTLR